MICTLFIYEVYSWGVIGVYTEYEAPGYRISSVRGRLNGLPKS